MKNFILYTNIVLLRHCNLGQHLSIGKYAYVENYVSAYYCDFKIPTIIQTQFLKMQEYVNAIYTRKTKSRFCYLMLPFIRNVSNFNLMRHL